MTLIEGIGDEVLVAFVVSLIVQVLFIALFYQYCRHSREDDASEETVARDNAPPIHNPHTCPICWGEQVLPLETNCGHLYCGTCLHTLYMQNFTHTLRNGVSCPMCRQEVTLLFVCFNNEERNAPSGSEMANNRSQVLSFARSYNRRFSNGRRTIWEQIRDAPILLRHFLQDAIDGENFENTFVNIRLFIMVIACGMYLLIPTDFLPEHMFGFLGLLDDLLILVVLALYIAASYRRFIAEQATF